MMLPKWLYEGLPITYGLSGGASLKYFLANSAMLGALSSTVLIAASAVIWYLRYDHRSNAKAYLKTTQRRRVVRQPGGSRTRR